MLTIVDLTIHSSLAEGVQACLSFFAMIRFHGRNYLCEGPYHNHQLQQSLQQELLQNPGVMMKITMHRSDRVMSEKAF